MLMPLDEIIKLIGGEVLNHGIYSSLIVEDITSKADFIDERKKTLYIAQITRDYDSHENIDEAIEKGIVACIISRREYFKGKEKSIIPFIYVEDTLEAYGKLARNYREKIQVPMIGVVGSNGKTTTKEMISLLLESKKKVYKTYGNYNTRHSVIGHMMHVTNDYDVAVIEMGIRQEGQMEFSSSIVRPFIGVMTSITDAHIGNYGSKENIAKAKSQMIDFVDHEGFLLLNGDDSYLRPLKNKYKGKTLFYGIKERDLDVRAYNIAWTQEGMKFDVEMDGKEYIKNIQIPVFGEHNVNNALPAIYIAYYYGISKNQIKKSFFTFKPYSMRFEILKEKNNIIIVNDAGNASPTSMKLGIDTFSRIYPNRKKILILGEIVELGEFEKKFYQEIGNYIESKNHEFEWVITVGKGVEVISNQCSGKKNHFHHSKQLFDFLKDTISPGYAIYFKAGRITGIGNEIYEKFNWVK